MSRRRRAGMRGAPRAETRGFSLIELLVVAAVLSLLAAILTPALVSSRQAARTAVCASNLRQLLTSNEEYAATNRDHYVPAAADIFTGFGGTRRWHGTRRSDSVSSDPSANRFEPARGPLARYLGADGAVKRCPSFHDYSADGALNAFEAGGGGYGYNYAYVGGRYDLYGASPQGAATSARATDIQRPAATVMFTDSAYPQAMAGGRVVLIEYSFCEPPAIQDQPGPASARRGTPSIHFRHGRRASTGWADGHLDPQRQAFSWHPLAKLRSTVEVLDVGWFGPTDNQLFDLR